ncbi:DUF4238 domain-containing protein [Nocardia sp. NPDC055049]
MTRTSDRALINAIVKATAAPFEHPWLGDEFVAESRRLAIDERGRKQHFVPKFYLDRWAVDGLVQPVQVDTRTAYVPQRPVEVATRKNLYTLPVSGQTMDLPLRWVEKHLSRIEGVCAQRLNELAEIGAGKLPIGELKADLSVFLGFQISRTPAARERYLMLIKGPAAGKRRYLREIMPQATEAQLEERMRPQFEDPKHEAIHLMFSDVQRTHANSLYRRRWAVYRSTNPLATCDDPVVALAGPPHPRTRWLAGLSAVVLYPVDAHHLLVMLRPDLHHRGSFTLTSDETADINREIVAAADRTVFERPGDQIALGVTVPPRPQAPIIDDATVEAMDEDSAFAVLVGQVRRWSRWSVDATAPDWPVRRWYRG